MNIKTKKIFKKIDKDFRKKREVTTYIIISFLVFTVLLSGLVFYQLGHSEGYKTKTFEINTKEKIQNEKNLMGFELKQVFEIFLKYLMIKTMSWLPWIIAALLIGWVCHGIF